MSGSTAPLLIDARALAQLLRVSLRTVWSWNALGRLPPPLHLSKGTVRWRLDEVRQWLDAGAPCREEWAARRSAQK